MQREKDGWSVCCVFACVSLYVCVYACVSTDAYSKCIRMRKACILFVSEIGMNAKVCSLPLRTGFCRSSQMMCRPVRDILASIDTSSSFGRRLPFQNMSLALMKGG